MRPSLRRTIICCGAACASVLLATAVSAQVPGLPIDCEYEVCALRIKQRILGQDLVRGVGEDRVDGLGFWIGGLDGAFSGSPVAQQLAAAYRRRHNTGAIMSLVGGVMTGVALFSMDFNGGGGESDSADWMFVAGAAISISGAIIGISGNDRLSRAIWQYNRALTR